MFHHYWKMHQKCPHCAIQFEREEGFFIMAIYMAYAVDILLMAPLLVITIMRHYPIEWLMIIAGIILVLFAPFTVRLTRTLWLYLDEWLDPR